MSLENERLLDDIGWHILQELQENARLSFAEKTTVLSVMEGLEPLKPLAGVLPAIVAFITYSEAAVFEPAARIVTGQPIGWSLSRYDGVADGRDDFQGYFHHRRQARA